MRCITRHKKRIDQVGKLNFESVKGVPNDELDHIACLLQKVPLFLDLDEALMVRVAQQTRILHVLRHHVVYRKGDPSDGFYVVSHGRIRFSLLSSNGTKRPIQTLSDGNSFGEATMLRELPHYTIGIAVEDSRLVFVPKEVVIELLQSDWRLPTKMLANLA